MNNIDEIDKDMLLRQSRILYPEVEDWVLNLAIEAYEISLHPQEKDELIENQFVFLYILITEYDIKIY